MDARRSGAAVALVAVWVGAGAGCEVVGEGDTFFVCPAPDPDAMAALPGRLSETGLYDESGALGPGVEPYRPAFQLWSDGAEKRRWLRLPPGTQIETSDMDDWSFPVGTRLWKEFRQGGVRIETRLIERLESGGWAAQAYVWNQADGDAIAAPAGFIDAAGTSHNVPAAGECVGCHGGRSSFVLGFSAIQLSIEGEPGELDLLDLVERDLLSAPPAAPFVIPGDEATRAALGYLHANCGHCHNQERPPAELAPCFDPDNELDFWLQAARLDAPEDTPTYTSAVGSKIEPGEAGASAVIDHMSSRSLFIPVLRMPPLGSELVDREGVDVVARWIEELR